MTDTSDYNPIQLETSAISPIDGYVHANLASVKHVAKTDSRVGYRLALRTSSSKPVVIVKTIPEDKDIISKNTIG